jgi:tRNA-dihydrouridine synthase
VLGSGDLFSAADAAAMLRQTGCDGVMFARGALGNPWIFRETLEIQAGLEPLLPTPAERGEAALRHLELFIAACGERVALREMRKHLCWYARGVPGAAQFRALVNRLQERGELVRALHEFFHQEPS